METAGGSLIHVILAGKSYVSVKSFSESYASLDIGPIDVKVKLSYYSFMSRLKKTLFVGSVLLSLEFLSLGFFINRTFAWGNQHVPSLLTATPPVDASPVRLDSPAKTDASFVLEKDGEITPRSGGFLTTIERAQVFLRSVVVVPFSFRIILTPKVSRYIFKSVLNL
jgi:hypothetical protein